VGDYLDPGTRQLIARATALCERSRFVREKAKTISLRVEPLLREHALREVSWADATSESHISNDCSTTSPPQTASA